MALKDYLPRFYAANGSFAVNIPAFSKAFGPVTSTSTLDSFQSFVHDGRSAIAHNGHLIREYRNTAFYCVNINADAVARANLRLYVATKAGQKKPNRYLHAKAIGPRRSDWVRSKAPLSTRNADEIEEVTSHPFLDLLHRPSRQENGWDAFCQFDLFSITQKYTEVTGVSYWYVDRNEAGLPVGIWPIPSDCIEPKSDEGSPNNIDYFEFMPRNRNRRRLEVDEVVFFRMPSLGDPYSEGMGPLQSALARIRIEHHYNNQTEAWLANRARPDGIISPDKNEGVININERTRMEAFFNQKFRGSGSGQMMFASDPIKFTPLNFSAKDMGELADLERTGHQIARAFGVPLSMLDKDANRASAEEGRRQHAKDTVLPRLIRIQDVINTTLIPMYDDTGRLFVSFDNPVPEDREAENLERKLYLETGQRVINEYRADDGLDPVEWGDKPIFLSAVAPQEQEEENDEDEDEPEEPEEEKPEKSVVRLTQEKIEQYERARKQIRDNDNAQ